MSQATVTIPLILFNEVFTTLGALPTSLKVAPVYEKLNDHIRNTLLQAIDIEQAKIEATLTSTTPAPTPKKRVRNRAPLPAKAMAQEFIKNNPNATRADVIKHLSSKGVSSPVASSTVGKLMKK